MTDHPNRFPSDKRVWRPSKLRFLIVAIKDEAKKKLQELWRDVPYLITDEVSTTSQALFATYLWNVALKALLVPPNAILLGV